MPRIQTTLTEKDIATVEATALTTQPKTNEALAVAAGVDTKDRRGKENIQADEILLPRIAGAQKTSPQIDDTSDQRIPGLKMFEMFNTLTNEVYGNGPLKFAVIRKLPFKAMQFEPDGGPVVDFDVPQGDPRLKFTTDDAGKRVRPIATEFREYLIILEDGSIAALSFKSTQIKVAAKLDSLQQFRPGAAWAGMYSLTSKGKVFAKGAATQFNVIPAGPTPDHLIKIADEVFENTKHTKIDVQRDTTSGEDDFEDTEGKPKF